jgi:Lrp/AsnC family transcriptional regulator, leucine-responsive regulatory protein
VGNFRQILTELPMSTISLDALDRRLLAAMQEDCTLGAEALAERCATSSSTALRRLGRLRAAGVIRKEVALIDAKAVGRNLMMIVNIRSERGATLNTMAFTGTVLAHPAVMQFYFVTGTNDYVAILAVSSMEEYDGFIESLLAIDAKVLTDTNVVIRPLKMSLAVPIDR